MRTVQDIFKDYDNDTKSSYLRGVSKYALNYYEAESLCAKNKLRDMLRKHPSWDEAEQSVVLEQKMDVDIDSEAVSSAVFEINEMLNLPRETRHMIWKWFVHDILEDELRAKLENFLHEGRKKTRVLKDYFNSLGLWDKSNGRLMTWYARLADAISPKTQNIKLILSIHPGYFLTMSNPAFSKRGGMLVSCHSLDRDDYDYNCGCTGYGLDEITMIAFTVDEDTPENRACRKTSRQLFMYEPGSGVLLQSRMYNSYGGVNGTDMYTKAYRQLVQECIATCEGIPNLWQTKDYCNSDLVDFMVNDEFGGYPDWEYEEFAAKVSINEARTSNKNTFEVGYSGMCLGCGEPVSRGIYCHDCYVDADYCDDDDEY